MSGMTPAHQLLSSPAATQCPPSAISNAVDVQVRDETSMILIEGV
jgi:hypothetical protein